MMKHFLLTVLFVPLLFFAEAKTSRALLIGINQYKPVGDAATNSPRLLWRNLSGCVNDAEAMKGIIVSKYGFALANITSLFNGEASRERIISEIKNLIATSQKGDIVFIYYAGHGSQMVNSLAVERDKKDETIVPADAYKGVADIRDKELNVFFNQLLDKGVVLTVIFDSCHSGSIGRGLYETTNTRFLEENPSDAKDPSDPPRPEDRGALIISAAQDFEFAKEIIDENKLPHGAFTLALLKAMQQNSVDASAGNLFSSVKAIMKFYGKTQEPVLAGLASRQTATLFGLPKGTLKNKITVAVASADAKGIELMGGFAVGLSVGVKLKSLQSKDTIIVTQMLGANKSLAKSLSAKKTMFAAGALFEVVSWTSSGAAALKIYVPQGLAEKDLAAALQAYATLRQSKKALWVQDITREKPQRVFQYSGNKWMASDSAEGVKIFGASFPSALVATTTSAKSFVNFPPSPSLLTELKTQFAAYNNVSIVSTPEESIYALTGSVNDKNEISYAFVQTNILLDDSSGVLPARTDFEKFDIGNSNAAAIAEKLAENVFKIAKIKDWLTLQPPAGDDRFPFTLQVQQYHSGKAPVNNTVAVGDTLAFYLQKTNDGQTWNRRKRYIYVFSLDAQGAMKLVFPNAASGNVENRFPITGELNKPEEKSLLAAILVKPPLGLDTYFMLSSEEAIGNLSAFNQPGVISRGPSSTATKNPLEALLFTGAKSRNKISTPLTWSINKISLHSKARK